MPWPPTVQQVLDELRIVAPQTAPDAGVLAEDLAAAVADVEGWRGDLFDSSDPPLFQAGANVERGTIKYAAALYTARASPGGTDPVTGLGAPPDIALSPTIGRLLGIGRYAKPRIG
jgi:hypothetical protein